MPWVSVSFEADAGRAEALGDALMEAGAIAVDLGDAAAGTQEERPVFGERGAVGEGGWRRVACTALFSPEADLASVFRQACRAAGIEAPIPYQVGRVDDLDWVRVTRAQFTPQQISERLWIVPTWAATPDPGAVNIVLDPGPAFGTGTHPTTRLCLRWLDTHIRGGESVIDFGCGSGILAIAALKLGAATAWGVDVDEQALVAARHNAVQNQVGVHFVGATETLESPAGIVVANILANPLRVLAPLLAKLTGPRGRVVLSGILAEQADAVRAAYLPWFEMDTTESEDGWVLLSGVKK